MTKKYKAPISLAINPANITASSNTTIQCSAFLVYADSSTEDITAQATWNITGNAAAGPAPGSIVTGSSIGIATITASYGTLTSTNSIINVLYGIFVSPLGNDTTGAGTSVNPYATIEHALGIALATGQSLYIAMGNYTPASSLDLTFNGVSLYGGYATDWTYDIANNRATITTGNGSPAAITCTSAITSATVIEGLIINGPVMGSTVTVAAINTAGTPTIRYCIISGGKGANYSNGIIATASSGTLIIDQSEIDGGIGPLYSYGISSSSGITVTTSYVYGGSSSTTSYGVYLSGTKNTAISNTIINGGIVTSAAATLVYGIYSVSTGTLTIDNNSDINGGITNGAGFGTSYGIWTNGYININYTTVNGGNGKTISYGVSSSYTGASLSIIDSSDINGGSAPTSTSCLFSVSPLSCSFVIKNSMINGGSGTGTNYGIVITSVGGSQYIYNNIIICGDPYTYSSYGVITNGGSSPIIANNTFAEINTFIAYVIYIEGTTRPYINNNLFQINTGTNGNAIFESTSSPTEVKNNLFYSDNSIVTYYAYYDYNSGLDWDAATLNANAFANGATIAMGNFNVNPPTVVMAGGNFVNSGFDYHLSAGSLAIDNGLNGIDQGWINFPLFGTLPVDFEGKIRPGTGMPWSIGAYEP